MKTTIVREVVIGDPITDEHREKLYMSPQPALWRNGSRAKSGLISSFATQTSSPYAFTPGERAKPSTARHRR